MKILVNLFCPKRVFLETNLHTLKMLFKQLDGQRYFSNINLEIIITGYCNKEFYQTIKDTINEISNSWQYRFKLFWDYDKVKSKCNLLNSYLDQTPNNNFLFYCEYDIVVPNLFYHLSFAEDLSKQSKDIAIWSFRHNAHQMSIYEQKKTTFAKNSKDIWTKLTLLRPFKDNGLIIGTGCFVLDLSRLDKTKLIKCPSYGYGNDDLHLFNMLQNNDKVVVVVKEWFADHRKIDFPIFERWKRDIIIHNKVVTKTDYFNFWDKIM